MLVFVEGGKPENPEKNPRSRDENQQQTQSTCDAGSGNRTRATAMGGECSHHYAIPAPQHSAKRGWCTILYTRRKRHRQNTRQIALFSVLLCTSQMFEWAVENHLARSTYMISIHRSLGLQGQQNVCRMLYAFRIVFQEYFRVTCLMSYSHNIYDQHGCLCIETISWPFFK